MEKHPTRFWDRHKGWEEAEKNWDENSAALKASHELRTFKELPKNEPGIRKNTKKICVGRH